GAVLARRGWDGGLLPAPRDSLMLTDSEVSSSKQSQEVERSADYAVDLTQDPPRARLVVTYTNRSVPHPGIHYQDVYRTLLRAYVPGGAALKATDGFVGPTRTDDECRRTVFGGEVAVPAGGSARAVFEYTLPPRVVRGHGYDVVVQQQP